MIFIRQGLIVHATNNLTRIKIMVGASVVKGVCVSVYDLLAELVYGHVCKGINAEDQVSNPP
jgi:hypothetical protein